MIDELLIPSAFPHPVTHLVLRETHISWVILTGPFAYKIKKPVRLDFIDCTALSTRQRLCREELALNRRMAPELYVDVVAVTRTGGTLRVGPVPGEPGTGEILDYAVKMIEFPEDAELTSLLDRGEATMAEITDLAQRLGEFHRRAPAAPAHPDFGLTERLRKAVAGNLAGLASNRHAPAEFPELRSLADWTRDAWQSLLPLLRKRETGGFIREGHGDLHSRNIVRWANRLVPFDCLEFDPDLRWIDIVNDIAFLFMDLISHDRPDLGIAFLDGHLAVTGDYEGVRLLRFYAVYRALVRAKIDSLPAGGSAAQQAVPQGRLRSRLAVAEKFARRRRPSLLIMHGPSGSGKTWMSERLAKSLNAVRIRSDVERKRLAGVDALTHVDAAPRQSIYSRESSLRTYRRLLTCAESCLDGGIDVIVDGAFLDASARQTFEALAARLQIPALIVSCNADRGVLAERVERRRAGSGDASDAGVGVLDWQLQSADPLTPAEKTRCIEVNTAAPTALADALSEIPPRLK